MCCSPHSDGCVLKVCDVQKKHFLSNIFVLYYSDIPNRVTRTKTDMQLSFQFSTKYLTLLLIVTQYIFFSTNQEAQLWLLSLLWYVSLPKLFNTPKCLYISPKCGCNWNWNILFNIISKIDGGEKHFCVVFCYLN